MLTREEMYVRAAELLGIIASEFLTDPMSVQCFDGRIVQESIDLSREIRRLDE